MSLEQKIDQLTAALVVLTEKTEALISIRTDAVETIKTAAAPAGKATKTNKNDAAATGKTEAASTETTTAAADAGAAAGAGGTDESVYEEAKKLVAAYTTGSDRPEEQQARKETVRTLLRHQKLVKPDLADPSKFSVMDVQEAMVPVLVKNLKAAIERGDITQPAAAAAGADDDLL